MSFLFYIQKPGSRKWDYLVLGSILCLILKYFHIFLTFFPSINSSLSVAAAGFSLNAPADTSFSYVRASFIKLNKDQIFIAGSIKINNSVSSNGWITATDGNWGGLLSENAECYLSGTTAALTFYSNGVNILFNARSSTVPAGIYTFFKLTNADSAVSI